MSNQFWIEGKFYNWHQAKELLNSNLFKENWQLDALSFIQAWFENHATFLQTTSGSTGKPKTIRLTRNQMIYSASTTLNFLKLPLYSQFLLCLNTQFIGAKMMIVRAILNCGTLFIIPPNTQIHTFFIDENFLSENKKLKNDGSSSFLPKINLLAVVPAQFQRLLQFTDNNIWENLKNIIVGGAALDIPYPNFLSQFSTNIYMSYGMSETASHIAISRFDSTFIPHRPTLFNTIGEVEIKTGEKENLKIRGIASNNNWIETNDWVKIINSTAFVCLGRIDFIINSGGVKISPEQLEKQFKEFNKITYINNKHQDIKFAISSLPNKKWGREPLLIVEKNKNKEYNVQLFQFCRTIVQKIKKNTHEENIKDNIGTKAIKKMMIIDTMPYTENGKINRYLLQKQIDQCVVDEKDCNKCRTNTTKEYDKSDVSCDIYPTNQILKL